MTEFEKIEDRFTDMFLKLSMRTDEIEHRMGTCNCYDTGVNMPGRVAKLEQQIRLIIEPLS